MMIQTPRTTYRTRDDATPEAEIFALAACYRIILESQSKRDRHLGKDGPDDGTMTKEDSANADYTRT